MGEHKLGSEFDKADRLAFNMQFAKKFLSDNAITMTVRPPSEKEVGDAIAKAKKKAQIYAVLDGSLIWLEVRVPGVKPIRIGAKDLDSLRDNGKQRGVLNKLADTTKLVTRAQVEKWHDTHYDSLELTVFAETISEMEQSRDAKQKEHDALKAYKFDIKDDVRRAELHAFTKPKSWEQYLNFVENIDAGVDGKKIFEMYVRTGADFPVNLLPPMKEKLSQQLASGTKLDFTAARELIVKVINAKLIPEMTKGRLPPLAKELARLQAELPEKKKEFIKAGGKP